MSRACIQIAVAGSVVLGVFPACHRTSPVPSGGGGGPVVNDTARIAPLEDTVRVEVSPTRGRTFRLEIPGQRDSLRATLRRERELWRAAGLRDYQFLLRVDCFCPGRQGWLSMEVRNGQLLRARDSTGKAVALNDWNTRSVDGLFDNLERAADIKGEIQVAFHPRWHFPTHVRIVARPGPDSWTVIEARGLRPS